MLDSHPGVLCLIIDQYVFISLVNVKITLNRLIISKRCGVTSYHMFSVIYTGYQIKPLSVLLLAFHITPCDEKGLFLSTVVNPVSKHKLRPECRYFSSTEFLKSGYYHAQKKQTRFLDHLRIAFCNALVIIGDDEKIIPQAQAVKRQSKQHITQNTRIMQVNYASFGISQALQFVHGGGTQESKLLSLCIMFLCLRIRNCPRQKDLTEQLWTGIPL